MRHIYLLPYAAVAEGKEKAKQRTETDMTRLCVEPFKHRRRAHTSRRMIKYDLGVCAQALAHVCCWRHAQIWCKFLWMSGSNAKTAVYMRQTLTATKQLSALNTHGPYLTSDAHKRPAGPHVPLSPSKDITAEMERCRDTRIRERESG